MTSVLLWSLIIVLFSLSFVGLFIPFMPSVLAIWAGFVLYEFTIESGSLSIMFWLSMVVLTAFLFIADLLTNKYFVGKFGGSRKSEWGAIVAFIFGIFIYPPFGIIILPFLTVYLIEYIDVGSSERAFRSATGTIVAFFGSIVVKAFVQFVMIVWFLIVILF